MASRYVSSALSDRQTRQTIPLEADPELKEKMLSMPDQIGKKIEEAFDSALQKQAEQLIQKLSKYDNIFSKQLEYKEASDKKVSQMPGLIIKSSVVSILVILLVVAGLAAFTFHQTNQAKLEREVAERKLAAEYSQKLKAMESNIASVETSLKEEIGQTAGLLDDRTSLLLDVVDRSGRARKRVLEERKEAEESEQNGLKEQSSEGHQ